MGIKTDNEDKERLSLYVGKTLMKRLDVCAERYGVAKTQLAIMLIGQGVCGIEKSFSLFDKVPMEMFKSPEDDYE